MRSPNSEQQALKKHDRIDNLSNPPVTDTLSKIYPKIIHRKIISPTFLCTVLWDPVTDGPLLEAMDLFRIIKKSGERESE